MAETSTATTPKNKVVYGLSNVHIAFLKSEDGAVPTYDDPIKVVGAVELSLEPQGDQVVKHADNIPLVTMNSNSGYDGNLTMTVFPDDVKAKMLGWTIDNNGALLEVADGVPTPFALMYDIEGDAKKRHCISYKVTANRPNINPKTTEDEIEFSDEVCPIKATPVTINGKSLATGSLELGVTNGDAFDGFFSKVYIPDFTTTPAQGE